MLGSGMYSLTALYYVLWKKNLTRTLYIVLYYVDVDVDIKM